MKKKVLIGVSSVFFIVLVITLSITLFKSDDNVILSDNTNNKSINNSFLTLMLEDENGNYVKSTSNTWPDGNYAFNSNLSRCENGGKLEYDRIAKKVILYNNKSDACYIYFDLYNVVEISNISTTKTYNSITVNVTTSGGENPVDKYYFSIDEGKTYQESSTPSYTFSNLTMNHEYTIQVYAKDTLGYSSNEEIINVTTNNYVNPKVNSVTASNVTNNSITVSVNATGGTNSIETYHYSINNGAYTSSSSNTYTFSNLSSGQTYSIRVYVKDTNGVDSNVYTLSVETDDTVLLADYIKGLYTSQGSNGLYYHTSSLANGAGDNSYRYSGANPNNYVCFGSDASTCPNDNLYRIIGVFGSEVKLIKADYATTSQTGTGGAYSNTYSGTGLSSGNYKGNQSLSSVGVYYWNNSTNNNTWSQSNLNTTNLKTTYLNSLGSTWRNKIASHTWYVGGHSTYSATPKTFYNAESSGTTWSGKIGLMYVSDYGFAASNNYWTTNMNSYNSARDNNWMYMGLYEWTISRLSSGSTNAFWVDFTGLLSHGDIFGVYYDDRAVRPSFYLNSDVTYVSGDGSKNSPYYIK